MSPSVDDLKSLTKKLDLRPINIIRKKDKLFQELQIDTIDDNGKILDLIAKNPKLLERPIVIKNDKAIIARPPELIYNFIK